MMKKTKEINTKHILNESIPFKIINLECATIQKTIIRMDGGAVAICTEGCAQIIINTQQHTIDKGCEVILLDDMQLFIKECSANFCMTLLIYSKNIETQATHKFEPAFFAHLLQYPIYKHSEGGEEMLLAYMKILRELQNDTRNRYNTLIATNLLRSIMLNIYDKIQRYGNSHNTSNSSRKEEIFYRFMELVIEKSLTHHDVAYYANRLCISTKYLAEITKEIAHETPKQSIDRYIISKIKLMLTFSDMSIQQIADLLHFPDQSYLGRFFKHHTGTSPSVYRQQGMIY